MINGKPLQGQDTANHILQEIVDNHDMVLVYFDPDMDGLVSGLFICQLLDKYKVPYITFMNEGRTHNFQAYHLLDEVDYIISGDFHVTHAQMDKITQKVKYISSDHHINPDGFYETPRGVILNNQFPEEPEEDHFQSGAGVVLDVLSHFDRSMLTPENLALVGVTLLSDVRDIENPLATKFLKLLYNWEYGTGQYLTRWMDQVNHFDRFQSFGVPVFDRNFIDFKLVPMVNAMLRFGCTKEAMGFVLGKNKISKNYHKLQKKLVSSLMKSAQVKEYPGFLLIRIEQGLDSLYNLSPFAGIIASRFAEDKPAVCYVVREEEEWGINRASFRGANSDLKYLDALNAYEPDLGIGHQPAFGLPNLRLPDHISVINRACLDAEVAFQTKVTNHTYTVENLRKYVNNGVVGKIAEQNNYLSRDNYHKLRYTGSNYSLSVSKPKYQIWVIDGVEVKCFDESLTPENGLIYPETDKKNLVLYLR